VSNSIKDTKRQTNKRLSVVSVKGVDPVGGRYAMLHRNLRGNKYPKSTNKYMKFGLLIISKIIKILPPDVTF